jgi:hypothetical protein
VRRTELSFSIWSVSTTSRTMTSPGQSGVTGRTCRSSALDRVREWVETLSIPENVLQRWKANTRALGIRLTDEDIELIAATGLGERLQVIDGIVTSTGARDVVPDYLADTRKMGDDRE